MLDSCTMTLPISLAALALVLGLLSFLLALLVGKRYHQINSENGRRLREFDEQLRSHADLHRSHGRRLLNLDSEAALCRSQIAQLNSSTGGFWRTALGTLLQIRQMSDGHIENALLHLEETGRADSGTVRLLRDEQKRRAYDAKMRANAAFKARVAMLDPNAKVEAKGTDVVQEFNKSVERSPVFAATEGELNGKPFAVARGALIDWPQVDKLVSDLVNRTCMSRLGGDLQKLQHLLRRGRTS